MESSELEDFEKFVKNVERTSELLKELNSADVSIQKKAVFEADSLFTSMEEEKSNKSLMNRTILNKVHSCESRPMNAEHNPGQSPEIFMKALEQDAEERRKRRQEKEKRAIVFKEQGNKAFTAGEYELAVKAYTEGLEQLRDMQTLYTNRAQAFIKLEKYKEAISDCQWALKCNEKCTKGYVHMGRAHLALKNFTEAKQCFEKILDIAPEHEAMVKDYLTQVDLDQKKTLQEELAQQELKEKKDGARKVPDLLLKLDKPNEHILYYCGGVELLTQTITNITGQTLFRLSNGFSVIAGTVSRCLKETSNELCKEELCVSVLRLWRTVCIGNEENQQLLLQHLGMREQIVQSLFSTSAVRPECLSLVSVYCQTQHGRRLIIEKLDLHRMVEILMDCICRHDTSGTMALAVLENLAGENNVTLAILTENNFTLTTVLDMQLEWFRTQFRETFTNKFAPPFENLLVMMIQEHFTASGHSLLHSFISVIGAMSVDEVIQSKMASRGEFWKTSFAAMERCASDEYRSIIYPLLGLIINIASNPNAAIHEDAVVGCSQCVVMLSDPDGGIVTRAAGLLSVILPKSLAATQEAVQRGVVKKLLKILKGSGKTSLGYSIKALAACTASSQQACEELVKLDKRLVTVRKLLGSSDELVVGNAALCLGHSFTVPGAAASLLGTDCVLLLLRQAAGMAEKAGVQKNSAIALGKLCKTEPRHIAKLRELHGLEILHSCMKLIS